MLDDGIKHKLNILNLNEGNYMNDKKILDYDYSGEEEVEYEV